MWATCYILTRNQGVSPQKETFLEEKDYNFFLDILVEVFKKYSVTLHSFTQITNHYHLLRETSKHNISDVMRSLWHLGKGRFQSYYLYYENNIFMSCR